jgi:tetratricopeptide (TPR) repeat protein
MSESELKHRAAEYFRRAYEHQVNGEYEEAIELYTHSIDAFPTAEAYTFRGWAYSFQGNFQQAIKECLLAIKTDPSFGNPYNDIGAYLIEQGRWQESIPWLEKATTATRYDAYCFPYFNLGRVYERLRDWKRARECYAQALRANRQYVIALQALKRLQAMWN